jgi:hypothetical protein
MLTAKYLSPGSTGADIETRANKALAAPKHHSKEFHPLFVGNEQKI